MLYSGSSELNNILNVVFLSLCLAIYDTLHGLVRIDNSET